MGSEAIEILPSAILDAQSASGSVSTQQRDLEHPGVLFRRAGEPQETPKPGVKLRRDVAT
jgi:hypothetical protein